MEHLSHKIALFIDADNAPAQYISTIIEQLEKHGTICSRKAYGNWKKDCLNGWATQLTAHAIQPIQQFDVTKGKNASDIALTIDVMEALFRDTEIAIFCIVSSDSDFTPLITKIRQLGKLAYGFGEQKTPKTFIDACNEFVLLDKDTATTSNQQRIQPTLIKPLEVQQKLDSIEKLLAQPAKKPKADNQPIKGQASKHPKCDTLLMNLLREATAPTKNKGGWVPLSIIGSLIKQQNAIDTARFGFKNLAELISAIDCFETKRGPNNQWLVRAKKESEVK